MILRQPACRVRSLTRRKRLNLNWETLGEGPESERRSCKHPTLRTNDTGELGSHSLRLRHVSDSVRVMLLAAHGSSARPRAVGHRYGGLAPGSHKRLASRKPSTPIAPNANRTLRIRVPPESCIAQCAKRRPHTEPSSRSWPCKTRDVRGQAARPGSPWHLARCG